MSAETNPAYKALNKPEFGFEMGLELSKDLQSWFALDKFDESELQERMRSINEHPERTILTTAETNPLLGSLYEALGVDYSADADGLRRLAQRWNMDFVLLNRQDSGQEPTMAGGVITSPSSWKPEEKIGQPISQIHSPVPTMQEDMRKRIFGFLNNISTGKIYERYGWGLAATNQADMHPSLDFPRISENDALEDLYLRVEKQGLTGLGSNGVLFMIKVHIRPVADLEQAIQDNLVSQIKTMPRDVAEYKGILPTKSRLAAG